ncbi:MAG: VanW family protein [Deltaproteobacteria bacterium]|nr:VanW family protein [Deltaproteobacteria bacterium]
MRLATRIALGTAGASLYVVPLAAWLLWIGRCPDVDRRIQLDGQAVGEDADRIEAWVQERSREKLETIFVLRHPGGEVSATLEELGFVPEVDSTIDALRRASALLHSGDPLSCWESWSALRGGGVSVSLVIGLEPGVLTDYLMDLKVAVDAPAREARIDFTTGDVTDEEEGVALEVHTAAAAIERTVIASGARAVDLPFSSIEPGLTADTLRSLDHSVVIADFSTTFPRRGKNASRAFNVEHGAAKLDGAIILPGRIMSFNGIVGERSLEAGFREAPEIYEGEMVEGVGGGTCQVSSTLHAAAFYAGLEIIERYPHSRPSSYVRMGLDATVSYPTVDLRIRNPYPFAVVVRTRTGKGRLTVEILGPTSPVTVTLHTVVIQRFAFKEIIEDDTSIATGVVYVVQYGLPGYLLRRVRKLTYADGTVRVEKDKDNYPPTTHLVRVSPETGYTGLTDVERGVEAEEADEGVLQEADLEERPADFAAPEASASLEKPWIIVNGPFAHPPKEKKKKP